MVKNICKFTIKYQVSLFIFTLVFIPVIYAGTDICFTTANQGSLPLNFAIPSTHSAVGEGGLPLPSDKFCYPAFSPVDSAQIAVNPAACKPIGVGSVAEHGDIVSIDIKLENPSGSYDLYLILQAPDLNPDEFFMLGQDGSFHPFSQRGLVKWKESASGKVDEKPFGSFPVSQLPGGSYKLMLMLTATGTCDAFYLWQTSFLAPASGKTANELLAAAQTWMYQIQGLDQDGALAALAATDYPLFVLEPGHNFSDYPYDTAEIVSSLEKTPEGQSRLLLAYIDIGQAEDYRNYWGANWVAPTATKIGSPDFLITIDPDGWSGNYPVAYWRPEWQNLWIGNAGIIATLARYGFDGVYLDWVEAYDDDKVIQAAVREGVEPRAEMIRFVEAIRAAGRAVSPDFLVVVQNAPYLLDFAPDRYSAAIDGLAVEDTWFHGEGDAEWSDPAAGDLPNLDDDEWSTTNRLRQYKKYQDYGLPVFSVDYCVSSKNAAQVYRDAKNAGLRSLVTRVSLSRLTETPPEVLPESNIRADGARQLTFATGTFSCQNPCFSPDGTFIVFTGFENGYNMGPAHIYRLDLAAGSQPVKLTSGDYDDVNVPYGCFERSTGRVIFASDREDDNDFWSINPVAGSTELRRLTFHGELPAWIEPVYSPIANIVAFESGPQSQGEEQQRSAIYTINLTIAKVTQMTNFSGTMDDRLPSWSPDGSQLLYQHRDPAIAGSIDKWEAWIIPAAGGAGTNLSATIIKDQSGPDTDLSWLANGDYVLSSASHGGIEHPSIFLLPVSGGRVIRLTNDAEHEDGAPCSSPDSKLVSFESHRTADENSPSDIWIIDNSF